MKYFDLDLKEKSEKTKLISPKNYFQKPESSRVKELQKGSSPIMVLA